MLFRPSLRTPFPAEAARLVVKPFMPVQYAKLPCIRRPLIVRQPQGVLFNGYCCGDSCPAGAVPGLARFSVILPPGKSPESDFVVI